MSRNLIVTLAALLAAASAGAQDRRPRIDVESYLIRAEINPRTQSLAATAEVRFVPLDDHVSSPVFELNNTLTVAKVTDSKGRDVQFSRNTQDFTIRVNLPEALSKGAPETLKSLTTAVSRAAKSRLSTASSSATFRATMRFCCIRRVGSR